MVEDSMTLRVSKDIGEIFKEYCKENGYTVKGKLSIIFKDWFAKSKEVAPK